MLGHTSSGELLPALTDQKGEPCAQLLRVPLGRMEMCCPDAVGRSMVTVNLLDDTHFVEEPSTGKELENSV